LPNFFIGAKIAFLPCSRVFSYKESTKALGFTVYDGPRLYLRLGDRVVHLRYEEWGNGVVVEEMTSTLIGGTCLVRILFDDGQQRTFSNDLDSDICCYYFGIRRQSHPLFDSERRRTTRTSAAKRLSQE
jgi:hypothetical protein